MENGATITGFSGTAVTLPQAGTFTMRGGTITGNGRGIAMHDRGTFTMQGGIITQNTGDGVHIGPGTFIMQGGTISSNNLGVSVGRYSLAGVSVGGTFRISGGIVHGNSGPDANTVALRMPVLSPDANPQPTARWGSGNTWQDIPVTGNDSPTRAQAIDMRTGVLQP